MASAAIYRVDKFVVPEAARDEFLARIRETHELLRRQPGFIRDAILEQVAGPGKFNIVTIAEWQDQAAIDAARDVVRRAHAQRGFSPQETMKRLGIEADIADYRAV
ncbi:MAG: antibiotic biosynthesis monooxygenase family protein [Limnochordales bacterium]